MEIIDGRYISNGDKNLYVKILGNGAPPIIIETAWGGLSVEWSHIQKELAKHTTVITYDRAGYGESPRGELPRSGSQIANELFNMLVYSGIKGPYIFIGHSTGGLFVQHFARLYPTEAAGVVLVDSITLENPEFEKLDAPEYQKIASGSARAENIRKYLDIDKEEFEEMMFAMLQDLYKNFPDEFKNQMIIYQSDRNFIQAIIDEFDAREETYKELKMLGAFPAIPLKILCRDWELMVEISKQIGLPDEEARAVEELWLKNNKNLVELSPKSEFILVKGGHHNLHLSRPDVIIEAALDILNKVK